MIEEKIKEITLKADLDKAIEYFTEYTPIKELQEHYTFRVISKDC